MWIVKISILAFAMLVINFLGSMIWLHESWVGLIGGGVLASAVILQGFLVHLLRSGDILWRDVVRLGLSNLPGHMACDLLMNASVPRLAMSPAWDNMPIAQQPIGVALEYQTATLVGFVGTGIGMLLFSIWVYNMLRLLDHYGSPKGD
jgi:hypothetical protein